MTKYKDLSLNQYIDLLSLKSPAPGGGSAAAVVASLGASLISMVVNYSIKKEQSPILTARFKVTLKHSEKLRKRFLDLADLDSKAFLKVLKTKNSSNEIKQQALEGARAVPLEVCGLCREAMELLPFLVECGNKFLISDVEVAAEFLLAAYKSALVNVEVNQ